jgi:hypothetical protein
MQKTSVNAHDPAPPSLTLYTKSQMNIYPISPSYFQRKLSIVTPGANGIFNLIATHVLANSNDEDFDPISGNHQLRRWAEINSKLLSPIAYKNFGSKQVTIEITIDSRCGNISVFSPSDKQIYTGSRLEFKATVGSMETFSVLIINREQYLSFFVSEKCSI